MGRQRGYQGFDAVVPTRPQQHQHLDSQMHHMQNHGMYENQKPYIMNGQPLGMEPHGQMMSSNGHQVPPNYPMYPPHQQHPGMDMQSYPTPYHAMHSHAPHFEMRQDPSGSAAPLAASTSRQNRRAQQAARNSQKTIASKQKRKLPPPSDNDDSDSEDGEGGVVPDGQTPSAADIARNKYNHVEDEKERKRLKRLLRNRVSAQQARERKKSYMGTLESRLKGLEDRNEELEERTNTLEKENFMLRQLLKTQTSKNPC